MSSTETPTQSRIPVRRPPLRHHSTTDYRHRVKHWRSETGQLGLNSQTASQNDPSPQPTTDSRPALVHSITSFSRDSRRSLSNYSAGESIDIGAEWKEANISEGSTPNITTRRDGVIWDPANKSLGSQDTAALLPLKSSLNPTVDESQLQPTIPMQIESASKHPIEAPLEDIVPDHDPRASPISSLGSLPVVRDRDRPQWQGFNTEDAQTLKEAVPRRPSLASRAKTLFGLDPQHKTPLVDDEGDGRAQERHSGTPKKSIKERREINKPSVGELHVPLSLDLPVIQKTPVIRPLPTDSSWPMPRTPYPIMTPPDRTFLWQTPQSRPYPETILETPAADTPQTVRLRSGHGPFSPADSIQSSNLRRRELPTRASSGSISSRTTTSDPVIRTRLDSPIHPPSPTSFAATDILLRPRRRRWFSSDGDLGERSASPQSLSGTLTRKPSLSRSALSRSSMDLVPPPATEATFGGPEPKIGVKKRSTMLSLLSTNSVESTDKKKGVRKAVSWAKRSKGSEEHRISLGEPNKWIEVPDSWIQKPRESASAQFAAVYKRVLSGKLFKSSHSGSPSSVPPEPSLGIRVPTPQPKASEDTDDREEDEHRLYDPLESDLEGFFFSRRSGTVAPGGSLAKPHGAWDSDNILMSQKELRSVAVTPGEIVPGFDMFGRPNFPQAPTMLYKAQLLKAVRNQSVPMSNEKDWFRVRMEEKDEKRSSGIDDLDEYQRALFEWEVPDHLRGSPLCPLSPKYRGKIKNFCIHHGKAKARAQNGRVAG